MDRKMQVMIPRAMWFCDKPQSEASTPWYARKASPVHLRTQNTLLTRYDRGPTHSHQEHQAWGTKCWRGHQSAMVIILIITLMLNYLH